MAFIAPKSRKLVSYMGPPGHNGNDLFGTYNSAEHAAQFAKAKTLGFDTIRNVVIANTSGVTGGFSFPSPTTGELANLVDYYNQLKAAGLNWEPILISTGAYYNQLANTQTWLAAVLGALPDTSIVSCFEIVGEQRWGLNPSGIVAFNQGVTTWLRANYPSIPVVQPCGYGTADLTACVAALKGTAGEPDWYDWHCYPGDYAPLAYINSAVAIVGSSARMTIDEYGFDVSAGTTGASDSTAMMQRTQADICQSIRWACQQAGLLEPGMWQLNDMSASSLFPSGQTFGCYDVNGNLRPQGQMLLNHPLGLIVPPVSLNDRTALVDTAGNAVFPRWFVTRGNSGSEPIVSTPTADGLGVVLSGSGTSSTSSPPALWWRAHNQPVIRAGSSYTFSASLAGDASASQPTLALVWYNATGGYVGYTGGTPLALNAAPSVYSITGTAPANAAACRISLSVGGNAGNITVRDPRLTGPANRLSRSAAGWTRRH